MPQRYFKLFLYYTFPEATEMKNNQLILIHFKYLNVVKIHTLGFKNYKYIKTIKFILIQLSSNCAKPII